LHNEEFHSLYPSPNVIGVVKWRIGLVCHVACMGKMRNSYKILV